MRKNDKMKLVIIFVIAIFCLPYLNKYASFQNIISLAGRWSFELDPDSAGYVENWSKKELTKSIMLPGTTDEAGFGKKTVGPDYGILTRVYKYIGPAWYRKEVNIPASWDNKPVMLYLERVLWESKVYLDGKEISTLAPLYVPHEHFLGRLSEGKHTITICVNNELIYDIGDKGHGYTEYTQTIWNGIVGKIELRKLNDISFANVKTFPDVSGQKLLLKTSLLNGSGNSANVSVNATLREKSSGKIIKEITKRMIVSPGKKNYNILMDSLTELKNGMNLTQIFTMYLLRSSIIRNTAGGMISLDLEMFQR